MTRKHYIAAARVIATTIGADGRVIDVAWRTTVARMVADIFEDDNPRFDRERFMVACGIQDKDGAK